jgi:hypothetical protein
MVSPRAIASLTKQRRSDSQSEAHLTAHVSKFLAGPQSKRATHIGLTVLHRWLAFRSALSARRVRSWVSPRTSRAVPAQSPVSWCSGRCRRTRRKILRPSQGCRTERPSDSSRHPGRGTPLTVVDMRVRPVSPEVDDDLASCTPSHQVGQCFISGFEWKGPIHDWPDDSGFDERRNLA